MKSVNVIACIATYTPTDTAYKKLQARSHRGAFGGQYHPSVLCLSNFVGPRNICL